MTDNKFTTWRPVKSGYYQRFKNRAWRLFGVKIEPWQRQFIVDRFEVRRKEWNRRRFGGLMGSTIRAYSKLFCENITEDFIIGRLLGEPDIKPMLFKMRQP